MKHAKEIAVAALGVLVFFGLCYLFEEQGMHGKIKIACIQASQGNAENLTECLEVMKEYNK